MDDDRWDDFMRWVRVRCVFSPEFRSTLQTLHYDYSCWRAPRRSMTRENGFRYRAGHLGKNQFSALLREAGFDFAKSSKRYVVGVKVADKDPWGAPDEVPGPSKLARAPDDDVSKEIDDLPFD